MKIRSFGQTDRGLVREKNEDAFFCSEEKGVFAVADGLGGLPRGSEASELAIKLLAESVFANPNGNLDLPTLFESINQRVFKEGQLYAGELGMGTTLTTAAVSDASMMIGHVGDTAIFRFRKESWDQLTIDHTMEQEIRDRLKPGEEAFIPDYFSHTLTRCIGQGKQIQTDVYHIEIEAGDRFLICSDGVTKTMQPEELARLINTVNTPEDFVSGVITLGNNRGGPDNITAIALFFEPAEGHEPSH